MIELPTIFAIGGGGFDSDSPNRAYLDKFFLQLTQKDNPRICFIPTASGDSLIRVARYLKACSQYTCRPTSLELYRPPSTDLESFVMEQDAIFVSGGSTRNLLILWKEWGLDSILHRAWQNNVVMGGVSAGANCWFAGCSTDSNFGSLSFLSALGWLPGICIPHYDEEPARKPHSVELLKSHPELTILAIDGGAGVLFQGTEAVGYYGEGGQAAYRVGPSGETMLRRM